MINGLLSENMIKNFSGVKKNPSRGRGYFYRLIANCFKNISFFYLKNGLLRRSYFLSLSILVLHSCQNDVQTMHAIITGKNIPSETMKGVEILYSDSAKVKMKLTGTKMDRYDGEKPHIVFPAGMNIFFYNDSMLLTSQLKANYGIRYELAGQMEVKGNVEVINVKGEKLNTEHLLWDESKNRIYTNEFVRITTGEEVIYGDGLESNQDFTKWRIKNIKGSFNLKDQGQDTALAEKRGSIL
jgi:LPS export ABC transporter protein LptC